MTRLRTRLERLEQQSGPQVVGITGIWNRHPGMVELVGTDEEMTMEEWRQRYPNGALIRVKYEDGGRDDDV